MDAVPALTRSLDARAGAGWSVRPLGASGFCATWRAERRDAARFVKTLPRASADVLDAEADGLSALAATATIRVPAVIDRWDDAEHDIAALSLEWLDFAAPDRGFGARLARALGALHRATPAEGGGRFGWRRDNRLGATLQANRWSDVGGTAGWIRFFARERLGAMRDRLAADDASSHAVLCAAVDEAIAALPRFFEDGHAPRASLVHGDLWSGNWAMLADGTPVVYDPAVSCSDAEAELAMMELFGAWPAGFRDAYAATAGLHAGYERRRPLYQLYHLLNHAVLFGGGYARQALAVARSVAP